MVEVFNVRTVAVTVPEDIDARVVVAWLRENYSTMHASVIETPQAMFVSIEAFRDSRLNNLLGDLQANADLLRRRTAEQ